jgi:hypothetical protein
VRERRSIGRNSSVHEADACTNAGEDCVSRRAEPATIRVARAADRNGLTGDVLDGSGRANSGGPVVTPSKTRRFDLVQVFILVIIPLGLLHHADHVGRADHSSWPFRPEVGPFTVTLLIYPVLVLVFLARRRPWVRVAGLGVVSLFTLLAHTMIEPPQQIYGTWANNLSTDALLYSVDREHMHNLFGIESPWLGVLATVLTAVLTVLLLVAWAVALRDARRAGHA